MKRILFALVVCSGIAGAQDQPFDFTVAFPDPKLQAMVRYSSGFGDALGAQQFAELNIPIGSRVVLMATSNVAYQHFAGSLYAAAQLEAMVDVVRLAGWHLAVDAGVRRHYDGSAIALGRLSLSQTTGMWSVAANVDVAEAFSGPDFETVNQVFPSGVLLRNTSPYRNQYFESVGATAKVASFVSLGAEELTAEGGRATSVFVGPVASFALPGGRARLDLSGGPIVCAAGNCNLPPDYTIIGRYDMPIPVHEVGYTMRLGISVGF